MTTSTTVPGLPRPDVTPAQATTLAAELFGVTGRVAELGSQQDRNFRIRAASGGPGAGDYLLKVDNPAFGPDEIGAQNAALARLAERGIEAPRPVPARDGRLVARTELGGRDLGVRLLTFLPGRPLAEQDHLAPPVVASLGRLAARCDVALADFDHPGLDRVLQWDLRRAGEVVAGLAHHLPAPRRTAVLAATDAALARLAPVREALRTGPVHGDLTHDNVVCVRAGDGRAHPVGVIDLGDLHRGWLAAELAVTCSSVLFHTEDPLDVLPAVRAYHEALPLTEPEVTALWPLVVLRGAVLVVSDAQQLALDGRNDYVAAAVESDWTLFERAAALPFALAEATLHDALGLSVGPSSAPSGVAPVLPGLPAPAVVDLSVTSDDLDEGRWLEPGVERELVAARLGLGPVLARWGEYRLTRARPLSAAEPEDLALFAEVFTTAPQPVTAPADAIVLAAGPDALDLDLGGMRVLLTGLVPGARAGQSVRAGQPVGRTVPGPETGLRVQLCVEPHLVPPAFATPSRARAWQRLCPDPSALLGVDASAPAPDPAGTLARRLAHYATVQEHYYADPPQIERGWRHHLVDTTGRVYLDGVNNVTSVGHGHPRVTHAAARQWARLNTNSRFHYGVLAEFAERLAALAPDPLDTVLLVNSGTEAVDLALRVARAATGREDVMAVLEAYHGWSIGADAVTTSVADNPQALGTRPDWVHLVAAPNAYRGAHRGAGSGPAYVAEIEARLAELDAAGHAPGAFICESISGNAGGVVLPDGYLAGAWAAVRAHGGLAVADEVQVGYGRLGRYFWGFEQQGVVPDVITIAKGMGNGHPLGAVVTTREIADRLAAEGSFFSSPGGSPVSCAVGLAVLDVIEDEGLPANAEAVGGRLRARFEELAARHPIIGAVHGLGLYLGVELVRDRDTLEPAAAECAAICDRMRELGVIMQPTGERGNVLKVKPPLCLDAAGADFLADTLDRVLTEGW